MHKTWLVTALIVVVVIAVVWRVDVLRKTVTGAA